jgi:hypothetical protein
MNRTLTRALAVAGVTAVSVTAASVPLGCGVILALDDHTSASTGSESDGATSGDGGTSGDGAPNRCEGVSAFCNANVPVNARLIAYAETTAECPAGFGKARPMSAAPASTTCSCACGRTQAEGCNHVAITPFTTDTCTTGGGPTTSRVVDGGACGKIGKLADFRATFSITRDPGACAVSYDAGAVGVGVACDVLPEACNGAGCATSVPGPFRLCVAGAGATCPDAFPTRITAGSGVVEDTRCTGCACTPNSNLDCADASVTAFAVADCLGAKKTFDNGACTPAYGDYVAIQVTQGTPSTDGGCALTGSAASDPGGALTLANAEAICCQ